MPCMTQTDLNPAIKAKREAAVVRLEAALAAGQVSLVIGPTGGVAFKGWTDNQGASDLCAYRRLAASNSPALRKALARAEVTSGRKIDARTVAAGVHSHDGGNTWSAH